MKVKHLFLSVIISCFFISCSKDAIDSANDTNAEASEINGTWRETTTGLKLVISGVSSTTLGKGVISDCGTAYPASALGGTPMTKVEYKTGKYWDAYNNTFNPPSTWTQNNIIGLAMNPGGSQFLIGTAIYVRQ